ncbi:MAG TPA: outer membrane lipoprotein chaperone LolA [Gammaproteobacteria bacterium]|nr:outer membrane lipoprotein chaperone LolA [Gammaproteobacteria bacterium]
MKSFLLKGLCLSLFLLTLTAQAQTASDDLTQLLSSFQSMSAQFQQVVFNSNGKALQRSSGQMALMRPGKFRWQVFKPNPQLLIANGRNLWIYDIDLSQATQQHLDKNNNNSPASLLSGSIEDLENRFIVTQKTSQSFQLKPKSENDMFKWIELTFSNSKLTQMRLMDNLGSLTDFHFSQVSINPKLNAGLFQFKAPRGVEVIKN